MDIKKSWADSANFYSIQHEVQFHNWFNSAQTMHQSISDGSIDFYHRIFTQDVYQYLGDPREKTSLEIGFGGGRLLRAALEVFKTTYGIDLSNEQTFNRVSDFLNKFAYNKDRFNLVHRNHISIIPDQSIDFVYSFIVFQHFDSFKEVEFYFDLFNRVMRKNAFGKIFFTRGDRQVTEKEFNANPRMETLFIQDQEFEILLQKYNFKLLNIMPAGKKQLWANPNNLSSQSVLTFIKT